MKQGLACLLTPLDNSFATVSATAELNARNKHVYRINDLISIAF